MELLGFYNTPRIMANPFQVRCNTVEEITAFIKDNSGKRPVFTSHNRYPTFDGKEPNQIEISKLFSDFDSPKIENALLDARKLDQFLEDENIGRYPVFSGAKGFHIYTLLRPQTFVFGTFLRRATRAIHLWLKNKLNLRTLDMHCTDPKRLCRVWYTPHSTDNKKGVQKQNGLYCCPLLPEWLHTWDINEILEYAAHPTLINYNPMKLESWKALYLSLEEFLDHFSIDPTTILDENSQENNISSKLSEYKVVNDDLITNLIPHPCIHTHLIHNPNPPHIVRFAATVHLKSLGYDRKWIFDFFQSRSFIDGFRTDRCSYQVNHIFDHSPAYSHPSCQTLYDHGLCIGPKCPKYRA